MTWVQEEFVLRPDSDDAIIERARCIIERYGIQIAIEDLM
jgi:hypothetical protein